MELGRQNKLVTCDYCAREVVASEPDLHDAHCPVPRQMAVCDELIALVNVSDDHGSDDGA